MTRKILSCIFIVSVMAVLQSCSSPPIYDQSYSFKNHEWPQTIKPSFKFEIEDTSATYQLDFLLRTTTDYHFSNAWLNISIQFPDGTQLRQPYPLKIADNNGWLGEKSGTVVENTLSFPNTILPKKGKYRVVVEQATPETVLTEVLSISLRVKERDAKNAKNNPNSKRG